MPSGGDVIARPLEQRRTSGGNAPGGRREQPPLQPCRKHTFVAQGVQKTSVYCTAPAARDDRLSKYSSSAGPPLLQRVVAGWPLRSVTFSQSETTVGPGSCGIAGTTRISAVWPGENCSSRSRNRRQCARCCSAGNEIWRTSTGRFPFHVTPCRDPRRPRSRRFQSDPLTTFRANSAIALNLQANARPANPAPPAQSRVLRSSGRITRYPDKALAGGLRTILAGEPDLREALP